MITLAIEIDCEPHHCGKCAFLMKGENWGLCKAPFDAGKLLLAQGNRFVRTEQCQGIELVEWVINTDITGETP
jgi:hypothetical protein